MLFGFTKKTQTVSESDAAPGQDFFRATIGFATQRDSEQPWEIVFRYIDSIGENSAVVRSLVYTGADKIDARFGDLVWGLLVEVRVLQPKQDEIPNTCTTCYGYKKRLFG